MTYSISRYYNTEAAITTLLCKLTNQICVRCVAFIESGGKLWEQPAAELLARLGEAVGVEEAYREEFHKMQRSLAQSVEGAATHRPLQLDDRLVFGKLELLTNRMVKLSEL